MRRGAPRVTGRPVLNRPPPAGAGPSPRHIKPSGGAGRGGRRGRRRRGGEGAALPARPRLGAPARSAHGRRPRGPTAAAAAGVGCTPATTRARVRGAGETTRAGRTCYVCGLKRPGLLRARHSPPRRRRPDEQTRSPLRPLHHAVSARTFTPSTPHVPKRRRRGHPRTRPRPRPAPPPALPARAQPPPLLPRTRGASKQNAKDPPGRGDRGADKGRYCSGARTLGLPATRPLADRPCAVRRNPRPVLDDRPCAVPKPPPRAPAARPILADRHHGEPGPPPVPDPRPRCCPPPSRRDGTSAPLRTSALAPCARNPRDSQRWTPEAPPSAPAPVSRPEHHTPVTPGPLGEGRAHHSAGAAGQDTVVSPKSPRRTPCLRPLNSTGAEQTRAPWSRLPFETTKPRTVYLSFAHRSM